MGDLPLRTPRHRRLGGPLPRQLANVTHAHPLPETLWPHGDAPTRRYAVLDGISPGYRPGAGRLHTRYSPVRRSPAECCHSPLPLDLHVLGLSLAFILSQDQTLRCKINYKSVLCPKRSIVVAQIDKGLLSSAAIPYYI